MTLRENWFHEWCRCKSRMQGRRKWNPTITAVKLFKADGRQANGSEDRLGNDHGCLTWHVCLMNMIAMKNGSLMAHWFHFGSRSRESETPTFGENLDKKTLASIPSPICYCFWPIICCGLVDPRYTFSFCMLQSFNKSFSSVYKLHALSRRTHQFSPAYRNGLSQCQQSQQDQVPHLFHRSLSTIVSPGTCGHGVHIVLSQTPFALTSPPPTLELGMKM